MMSFLHYTFLFMYVLLNISGSLNNIVPCNEKFSSKCLCGITNYTGESMYVVNCSNTNFENASILQNLPDETEVLIFSGNNVYSLPLNIFGTNGNYTKLKVVDMTNNNIHEIKGKTFHRVAFVERLILNHNSISLSSQHPRVFSNFNKLTELHLTDAFMDNGSDNLASELHNVFINSSLTHLQKIHLEQNEIVDFKDKRAFCDLPKLMHLYLGNNLLSHVNFELSCLQNLQFLDLEGNRISSFSDIDLQSLDSLPSLDRKFTIDISDNPFICDCGINNFYSWLSKTKVDVRNREHLTCRDSNSSLISSAVELIQQCHKQYYNNVINYTMLILVLILMSYLTYIIAKQTSIYYRRNPVLISKVQYTIIGNNKINEEAQL